MGKTATDNRCALYGSSFGAGAQGCAEAESIVSCQISSPNLYVLPQKFAEQEYAETML